MPRKFVINIEAARVYEIKQEWKITKELESDEIVSLFWPGISNSILELYRYSQKI